MQKLNLKDWENKLRISLIIIVLIAIVIGVSLVIYRYEYLLKNNNRITKGVVLDRKPGYKSKVFIVCSYRVDSLSYEVQSTINYFEHTHKCIFDIGDSVIIRYYPPNPDIVEVDLDSSYSRWKSSFFETDIKNEVLDIIKKLKE